MTARRLLYLSLLFALPLSAGGGRTLDTMEPVARETALLGVQLSDAYWDDRAAFLWDTSENAPAGVTQPKTPNNNWVWASSRRHHLRSTSDYAFGLLMRGGPGDREKAIRAIEAVLDQQIDDPAESYHGTFQRFPEEPRPPREHLPPGDNGSSFGHARLFVEYDPNWREFIGTTLIMILEEYSNQLPAPLRRRMEEAIVKAVEGERKEGRLTRSYTNVALMYGLLLSWAGQHLNRPEWLTEGQQWCTDLYNLFKKNGTFEEYGSLEHQSVDLYALALWRVYGPTAAIRSMGSEVEADLWKDTASHYNANLKNIAGPYDRAENMDMRKTAIGTGVWLRTVLGPGLAPLPEISPGRQSPIPWGNAFIEAPQFAVLGANIPDEALKHFQGFVKERQVRCVIDANRVATAWIGRDIMMGAESTNFTRQPGQPFVPGTVHWKMPDGDVGWIRLYAGPRLNAHAEKETLSIQGVGDYTFRVAAPGLDAKSLQRSDWTLPGLRLKVETDATGMNVKLGRGFVDVEYLEATKITLRVAGTTQ